MPLSNQHISRPPAPRLTDTCSKPLLLKICCPARGLEYLSGKWSLRGACLDSHKLKIPFIDVLQLSFFIFEQLISQVLQKEMPFKEAH